MYIYIYIYIYYMYNIYIYIYIIFYLVIFSRASCRNKKQRMLIAFNDMIADMLSNKKLNPIVIELFIRRRHLN